MEALSEGSEALAGLQPAPATAVALEEYVCRVVALCKSRRWYKAAQKVWPGYFVPNRNTERLFAALSRGERRLCVPGHGSASKTFSVMAYVLLRYWIAPKRVAATVTGATLTSLRTRAWADLKLLIDHSVIPLGLEVMESRMMVRLPTTGLVDDKHTIEFIAAEHKDSQSKVQGHHAEETILVIEEADNRTSESVWTAETNLATSGEFMRIALANPFDRTSKFGQRCEPPGGWDTIDADVHKEWESKTGDHVVRLDGYDSPNYIARRTIISFLLSWEWFEETLRTKGEQSAEFWAYGRGMFPPTGLVASIWPLEVINATLARRVIFYSHTRTLAALDPAFMEDGDKCCLVFGRLGRQAKDPRLPCLQTDEWIYLKRRNVAKERTQDLAEQVIELCNAHNVAPEDFIMDYTGNALGLGDTIATLWQNAAQQNIGKKIHRIIFAGAATRMKILAEDSRLPDARFDRLVTEMAFAAMEWGRSGCLGLDGAPAELRLQLEARLSILLKGEKKAAESKKEMKKRGYHSPDELDALGLLVHLARMKERNVRPSGNSDNTTPLSNTLLIDPDQTTRDGTSIMPQLIVTMGQLHPSKPTNLPDVVLKSVGLMRSKRKSPLAQEPEYADDEDPGTQQRDPDGF